MADAVRDFFPGETNNFSPRESSDPITKALGDKAYRDGNQEEVPNAVNVAPQESLTIPVENNSNKQEIQNEVTTLQEEIAKTRKVLDELLNFLNTKADEIDSVSKDNQSEYARGLRNKVQEIQTDFSSIEQEVLTVGSLIESAGPLTPESQTQVMQICQTLERQLVELLGDERTVGKIGKLEDDAGLQEQDFSNKVSQMGDIDSASDIGIKLQHYNDVYSQLGFGAKRLKDMNKTQLLITLGTLSFKVKNFS